MVSNRLIWTAIFISISSCCDVMDALTDVMLGDGVDMMSAVIPDVDMLSDMGIVVMITPEITLDFVLGIVYAVDVLGGLPDVKIIGAVTAIDIGMFADENADGLATPLEFTLLST